MDALALLCNLHADGPSTRKRLHRRGCDTLDDLLAIPAAELAGNLGTTLAHARRLIGEARSLARRAGGSLLEGGGDEGVEPERPELDETPSRVSGEPLRPGLIAGLDGSFCARLSDSGVGTLEDLAGAALLDLSRSHGLPYARLLELQCLARRLLAGTIRPVPRAGGEIEPAPSTAGVPLRPGGLEGLDGPLCERLVFAGTATLEDLVDAPALHLSRAAGLGLPLILDLQVQARRRLEGPRPRREVAATRDLIPRPPAPLAPGPLAPASVHRREDRPGPGSAGPFA